MSKANCWIAIQGKDICPIEETILHIRYGFDCGAVTHYGIMPENYQVEGDLRYVDFWKQNHNACITIDEDASELLIEPFLSELNLKNENLRIVKDFQTDFDHYDENIYDICFWKLFLQKFNDLATLIKKAPLKYCSLYDKFFVRNILSSVLEPPLKYQKGISLEELRNLSRKELLVKENL